MAMPVLATKLFVPPPRPSAVLRSRLIEHLHDGLHAGRKLALVSAPAGFGKTTLVSEWVADLERRDPAIRIAWVSLDEADNDPPRFVSYLLAALGRADPALGIDAIDPKHAPSDTISVLINEIAASTREIVLVLDDFHLIEDASIRDAMTLLIDNLPPRLHVTIASRSDPLLPLSRMRARGELTELRAADLRFTPDEAAEFLALATGVTLSSADVAALDTRTEGWIAGLQLAALSMRDRSDVSGFIDAFTGSNRFVIDYLIEEVLHRAPLNVREFLCDTAILDRMTGPLCDAVTGQTGGTETLESLERANVFIVPLDDQRTWYRYHHLFADVLRSRLQAHGTERVALLHRRASEWLENNDAPDDAIRHAFAADDIPRAARLLEASMPAARKTRQDGELLRWLALLPEDTVRRRPVLSMFLGWSSLVSGDIDAVEPWLATAEQLLAETNPDGTPAHGSPDSDELRTLPVSIELYRAAVAQARGDLPGTAIHAQRALELTAADDHFGRGAAAGMLGLAQAARGELEAGVRAFAEASASLNRAGNRADTLTMNLVVADMLVPLGRLGEARALLERALVAALGEGNGGPPTADLRAGYADLLREFGEIDAATEQLTAADALGEAAFSNEHHYRWFTAMAGVRRAEGRLDEALDLLATAAEVYRRGYFPDVRPIPAMKARIWIALGRLDEAQAWAHAEGLTSADDLTYLREYEHITLARLLIAQHRADPSGGTLSEATALLDRLRTAAEAGKRAGSAAEIEELLGMAAEAPDRDPVSSANPLTGALSDRELQVLRLLATELSGPDIARELYVSLNTMRTHTKHIFEKLDAKSRSVAVRKASDLGLI